MISINRIINRRIILLLFLLCVDGALYYINRQGYLEIPPDVIKALDIFFAALFSFLIVNIILRFTENRVFHLLEKEVAIEERIFLTKVYKTFLYFMALTVILVAAGFSFQNLTLFLGLIATGLALAVRDLLMSYLVWFVIITKKPFRIGECVRIGDEFGIVRRIGTVFTTLEGEQNGSSRIIKLPNKIILDRTIVNYGGDLLLDVLKIPLRSTGAGVQDRLESLKKLAATLLPEGRIVSQWVDMDNEKWWLMLEYQVEFFKRQEVRSQIMEQVLKQGHYEE